MYFSAFWWVRGYRIFFALLTLMALAMQLTESIEAERSTVDFFSYFTIQSNMIAVSILLWTAIRPKQVSQREIQDIFRGASVLYLAVTGIVFAVLLSNLPLVTNPFSNMVMHQLMPVVIVLDWMLDPPSQTLSFRKATVWLAYAGGWIGYTLIRGVWVEWYPYPFLNPETVGGYAYVLFNITVILCMALLLIWIITWIGKMSRKVYDGMKS